MKARDFLKKIRSGEMSIKEGEEFLRLYPFMEIPGGTIDTHRMWRKGFPEVIWGQDKTVEELEKILLGLHQAGQPVLITRVDEEKGQKLKQRFPKGEYNREAKTFVYGKKMPRLKRGKLLIVTAGMSDNAVGEEARVIAEFMGAQVLFLKDVGVAGVHRLFAHWKKIQEADVIIAVAGMEGALPSLLAGIVGCPVIAVPTSVGYGTHLGGIAPLLTMLNSCSSGVAVVNVDNGFGAAYLAFLILKLLNKEKK
ncbi:MAG: nickel pincer cofactor biosynthesis protein LarB [bacterium]